MPGSTIQLMTEGQEMPDGRKRFKRFYICLAPLKNGFINGCRPLLGLDGCHLKGPYDGQLLAAVVTDANNGMYPLAWAVVEAENSKRNMWKDHKGIGIRMLLWLAARATTDYTFNKHMEEMKKLSKKCFNWLSEKPRSQWSRSAFRPFCKSDMFVNNHSEVFNSSIRRYRDLPIISMFKFIHVDVMRRIQMRRDKMQNSYALNPICPNAMGRLNKYILLTINFIFKAIEQSRGYHVIWSGGARYLVTMTSDGYEIFVDLDAHTCACKKWQLSGIPCYHACACIAWSKKPFEPFIHQSYNKDMFLSCYQHIVEPIYGEEE
ncbi:uncharacterized protein LOC141691975 [Apium graveolens]|uniref:uncharacterized protein LOC141691975 n=1 Tax=Apium graveolens TaxID=4045 RepID=UPI003D7B6B76